MSLAVFPSPRKGGEREKQENQLPRNSENPHGVNLNGR